MAVHIGKLPKDRLVRKGDNTLFGLASKQNRRREMHTDYLLSSRSESGARRQGHRYADFPVCSLTLVEEHSPAYGSTSQSDVDVSQSLSAEIQTEAERVFISICDERDWHTN